MRMFEEKYNSIHLDFYKNNSFEKTSYFGIFLGGGICGCLCGLLFIKSVLMGTTASNYKFLNYLVVIGLVVGALIGS